MSVFTRRGTRTNGTRKRIWVQHVAVETDKSRCACRRSGREER